MEYYLTVNLPGQSFNTEHSAQPDDVWEIYKLIKGALPGAEYTFVQKYRPGDYREFKASEFSDKFLTFD
jgi:hypothetical protein